MVIWRTLCIFFLKSVSSETISEIVGDDFLDDSVYFESGPYGSNNDGSWFTDFRQKLDGSRFEPRHWPDTINVRAGQSIDGIQVTYGAYRGYFHGGRDGGYLNKIRLYNDDKITRVTGRSGLGPGAQVDQLTFYTRNGKTMGPFGGEGGRGFVAEPPEIFSPLSGKRLPCYLGWISGQSDYNRVTAISFHWRCPKYERPAEALVPSKDNRQDWGSVAFNNASHKSICSKSYFISIVITLTLKHVMVQ